MPDSYNNIWIDSSFNSASSGDRDAKVEFVLAEADVVGGYSLPIIYNVVETEAAVIDSQVEYLQYYMTVSGIINAPIEYFTVENIPTYDDGIIPALIFYSTGDTAVSGTQYIDIHYQTGFIAVAGSFSQIVNFIVGNQYPGSYSSYINVWLYPSNDTALSFISNYTNFSGNLTTSGTPIPFNTLERDNITVYSAGALQDIGWLNKIVNITFAGWVDNYFDADIYSVDHNIITGYINDVTVISGGVLAQCLDVYSTTRSIISSDLDVFCSLLDYIGVVFDVWTGPGKIGYELLDVFSTDSSTKGIVCDVDLLSLKITNFSLAEGQHTEASNSITIDILDDVCPVSVSGTYFKINDVQVSGTLIPITDGYRLVYDPTDNFESLNGPTIFTAHAENECGKIIEQSFNLTFGYIVGYENSESVGIDYGFNNKVAVRITAEDMASCPQLSATAYVLESDQLKNRDLGASITGVFYADGYKDMATSIYPQSTAYFYGKEFKIVVHAKDFAGNSMTPFEIMYRIENKPAN